MTKPLNDFEHVKARSRHLRGGIAAGLADPLTGAISEDDAKLLKFHGSYQQDDRDLREERRRAKLEPDHQFMVRARLPGGVLNVIRHTVEVYVDPEQIPEQFTANMAKRARKGRIYIDYLRNTRGATAVGAYSPRARPGAPVSTPVSWQEVERGIRAADLTLASVPERLAALPADPWAEMADCRQTLGAALRRRIGI